MKAKPGALQADLQPVRLPLPPLVRRSVMQCKRTWLAGPSRGLAWFNPDLSDEVLVRLALRHGAFHLALDSVLDFGLAFVLQLGGSGLNEPTPPQTFAGSARSVSTPHPPRIYQCMALAEGDSLQMI